MTEPSVIDRLRGHGLLGDAPLEELEWLAAHGELRRYRIGDVISSQTMDHPPRELMIVFSGCIALYRTQGDTQRRTIEWGAGEATGLLPYSRFRVASGTVRIDAPTEILAVPGHYLERLARECHAVTTKLVRLMLDRARWFQKEDLHQARLASLGRLAAGLAHELDNPASAVVRGAKQLIGLLQDADAAARALGAAGMPPERFSAIEKLRDDCLAAPLQQVRSPLEQARHEEAITDWLDDHAVELDDAASLAETPLTTDLLDALSAMVEPSQLEPVIRWLSATCAVHTLGAEVGDAAVRISDLVRSVKGFTQMDASATPQPVDIETGLTQTLAVLRAKARAKSVRISIHVQPGLPPVSAVAGELNQVWANLIENAVDAIDAGGSVDITAEAAADDIVVCVRDDGPGIPEDSREKIFEPFFTTKGVGEGTGLGLDIVRRLVDRHNGSIELSSRPGSTEFRIRLPVHERKPEVARS